MSAIDDLRLAWEAHREGRNARRDALLTLAVAGSQKGQRSWVRPIVAFLIRSRPDHLFSGFNRLETALADPRVTANLGRLRMTFPPARVRSLIERADVSRGPFTGRNPSIDSMIQDLTSGYRLSSSRLGTPMPQPEPIAPTFAGDGLGFPPDSDPLLRFYLATLLATATLFSIVLRESDEKKAA